MEIDYEKIRRIHRKEIRLALKYDEGAKKEKLAKKLQKYYNTHVTYHPECPKCKGTLDVDSLIFSEMRKEESFPCPNCGHRMPFNVVCEMIEHVQKQRHEYMNYKITIEQKMKI